MNYQRRILGISMASVMLLTLFAVCTTTASAVPAATNIGPAVSPWKSSTGSGIDLYYVGASDHRIYWAAYYDSTSYTPAHWSSAVSYNGWTFAQLAPISRSSSDLALFYTGTDGAV